MPIQIPIEPDQVVYNERFTFGLRRTFDSTEHESVSVTIDDSEVTLERLYEAFDRFLRSAGFVLPED